jgi:collagen type VI alpha
VDAANAVMNISYIGGTTNTAAALAYVTDTMFTEANGDRSNVMNLAIVITDGESNDKQATIAQAVRAKTTKDIQIVSVGVGNWINVYELNAIASYPFQTHYLNISNYQNLTSHFNEFFALICNGKCIWLTYSCCAHVLF